MSLRRVSQRDAHQSIFSCQHIYLLWFAVPSGQGKITIVIIDQVNNNTPISNADPHLELTQPDHLPGCNPAAPIRLIRFIEGLPLDAAQSVEPPLHNHNAQFLILQLVQWTRSARAGRSKSICLPSGDMRNIAEVASAGQV